MRIPRLCDLHNYITSIIVPVGTISRLPSLALEHLLTRKNFNAQHSSSSHPPRLRFSNVLPPFRNKSRTAPNHMRSFLHTAAAPSPATTESVCRQGGNIRPINCPPGQVCQLQGPAPANPDVARTGKCVPATGERLSLKQQCHDDDFASRTENYPVGSKSGKGIGIGTWGLL